jgi:hypothetical protein
MEVVERDLTGAAVAGVFMRITARAVLCASASARSPGDETSAKRWMTPPERNESVGARAAVDGAGCSARAGAGAGLLSATAGTRCSARSNDTTIDRQWAPSTSGSRINTGRTKRRTLWSTSHTPLVALR